MIATIIKRVPISLSCSEREGERLTASLGDVLLVQHPESVTASAVVVSAGGLWHGRTLGILTRPSQTEEPLLSVLAAWAGTNEHNETTILALIYTVYNIMHKFGSTPFFHNRRW